MVVIFFETGLDFRKYFFLNTIRIFFNFYKFPHNRLAIVTEPLMPCWETIWIAFSYDAHLHPTFLFNRFKCLMLFTNQFSSLIQCSCMMQTKCS